MSRNQNSDEPSMEELLASIRRAIHEEEGLSRARADQRPVPKMPGAPTPVPSVASDIATLREQIQQELSGDRQRLQFQEPPQPVAYANPRPVRRASPPQAHYAQPAYSAPKQPTPAPVAAPAPVKQPTSFAGGFSQNRPSPGPAAGRGHQAPRRAEADRLTSQQAADSVAGAFERLSRPTVQKPASSALGRLQAERSFEEITREMLQPMLKQWLDRHLPALVERLVRAEIERIARRGR